MPAELVGRQGYKVWDAEAARLMGGRAQSSPAEVIELLWSLDPACKAAFVRANGASRRGGRELPGQLWAGGDDDLFLGKHLKDDFVGVIRERCVGCGLLGWAVQPCNRGTRDRLLHAILRANTCAEEAGAAHGDADNHRIRREGYAVVINLLAGCIKAEVAHGACLLVAGQVARGLLRHVDGLGLTSASACIARDARLCCGVRAWRAWKLLISRAQVPLIVGQVPRDLCSLLGVEGLCALAATSHALACVLRPVLQCPECQRRPRAAALPCGHKLCKLCAFAPERGGRCPRCHAIFSGAPCERLSLQAYSDPRTWAASLPSGCGGSASSWVGHMAEEASCSLDPCEDPRSVARLEPARESANGPEELQQLAFERLMDKIVECKKVTDLPGALQCYSDMLRVGLKPDLAVFNILIDLHAKNGQLHDAELAMSNVYSSGLQPDVKSFTCLINDCAAARACDRAEHWFSRMRESHVEPSATTYSVAMKVFLQSDHVEKAKDWFNSAKEAGKLQPASFHIFAKHYSERGDVRRTRQWLENIGNFQRDFRWGKRDYGYMLNAHASAGDLDGARMWFSKMEKAGLGLNTLDYSNLLKACAKAPRARSDVQQEAADVFRSQIRGGFQPDLLNLQTLSGVLGWKEVNRLCRELGTMTPGEARREFEALAPEYGLDKSKRHWGWRRGQDGVVTKDEFDERDMHSASCESSAVGRPLGDSGLGEADASCAAWPTHDAAPGGSPAQPTSERSRKHGRSSVPAGPDGEVWRDWGSGWQCGASRWSSSWGHDWGHSRAQWSEGCGGWWSRA
mmetsp:Transcript_9088/g.26796  ORF Transcript_9088/g.26796 Transcript_9088/m.26796 type:complete len:798 (-) Transcript_9088:90-2483(-)